MQQCPKHTLHKVRVADVLLQSRHCPLLEDSQVHKVEQNVIDVAKQHHQLEEHIEIISIRFVFLLHKVDQISYKYENSIEPEQSPQQGYLGG